MSQIRPEAGFPRSVDRSMKPRFFTRHIVSRLGLNSVRWWQLLLTGAEQFLADTGIVKRQCARALLPGHFERNDHPQSTPTSRAGRSRRGLDGEVPRPRRSL